MDIVALAATLRLESNVSVLGYLLWWFISLVSYAKVFYF